MGFSTQVFIVLVFLVFVQFVASQESFVTCPPGSTYVRGHTSEPSFAAGGPGSDYFSDMITYNNKIYAVGSYQNTINIAGSTATCPASTCAFIAVISNNLNSVQLTSFTATGSIYFSKIKIDPTSLGSVVFVTGRFSGTFANTASYGDFDIVVFKFNTNNNQVLWVKTAGGSGYDESTSLVVDGQNVFIGGAFYQQASFSFLTTLTGTQGKMNNFIAKYTMDGSIVTANTFALQTNTHETITSLELYSDQLYFSGNTGSVTSIGSISKQLTGQYSYVKANINSVSTSSTLGNNYFFAAGAVNGQILIIYTSLGTSGNVMFKSFTQPAKCRNSINTILVSGTRLIIAGTFAVCLSIDKVNIDMGSDLGTFGFFAEIDISNFNDWKPIFVKKIGALPSNNAVNGMGFAGASVYIAGKVFTNRRTSIDVGVGRNYLGYGDSDLFIDSFGSYCASCTQGTVSDGMKPCEKCPAGTFQSDNDYSKCVPCKPGEFQPNEGLTKCFKCATGTFSDTEKATTCTDCRLYETSKVGSSTCYVNSQILFVPLLGGVCLVGMVFFAVFVVVAVIIVKRRRDAKRADAFKRMEVEEPTVEAASSQMELTEQQ